MPLLVAALATFAVASAQGGKPAPPAKGPKLTITPASTTLGPVDPGVGASQEFVLGFKDGKTSGELVVTAGDGFAVTDDGCSGTALKPGQTCTVTATYTPSDYAESIEGTLTVIGKPDVKPAQALLFASSTDEPEEPPAPLVNAEPGLLDFGQQTVGLGYLPQPITFTNNSTEKVWLVESPAPAGFAAVYSGWAGCSDPFWGGVEAGGSCTGHIEFRPTAPGTYQQSFTTTWKNLAGETVSTTVVPLEGHAYADLVHTSVATLEFGSVAAGTVSDALDITFTNVSTDTLSLGSWMLTNTSSVVFSQTANTCYLGPGVGIGPGQTCTLSLTFSPPAGLTEATPYDGLFQTEWIVLGSVPPPGQEDPETVAITNTPLSGTGVASVPVNRAPTANNGEWQYFDTLPHSFTISGADPDGDPLTFQIVDYPTWGTLDTAEIGDASCSGGVPNECTATVSFTAPEYTYPYTSTSFTFVTTDGELQSNEATVSILVS